MTGTVSSTVTAAAQELLQLDAQPLLDEFTADIRGAANKLVGKLPPGAQGYAGLGANLLLGLAQIAAQAELGVILRHNVPPGMPLSPTPPAA